jgi:hypothetical protein
LILSPFGKGGLRGIEVLMFSPFEKGNKDAVPLWKRGIEGDFGVFYDS